MESNSFYLRNETYQNSIICLDRLQIIRPYMNDGGTIRYSKKHEAIEDFPIEWPPVLGYNKTIAKEGTQVPVTVNGDPLLVFGTYGKGKTAAFTSDCTHHWAPPAFTNWEHYNDLWKGILDYLTK